MAEDDSKDPTQSDEGKQGSGVSGDSSTQNLSLTSKEEAITDPWTGTASGNTREPSTVNTSSSDSNATGATSAGKKSSSSDGLDLSAENWERDVLNRLAFATLNEQRRSRRWNVFFKALAFVYVGAVLLVAYNPFETHPGGISGKKHTAVIEINGAIGTDTEASADNIVGGLREAFEDKDTAAVVLRINSPGGSPVQAGYVYDEIKRLRKLHPKTKLYAVIVDICASGGYYIAAAADEIYADKASIVGSIGVLMNGFGFVEAMKKVGVERRLITAGKYKGAMDPFSPVKKEELNHVKGMLDDIHQQFIKVVKDGRGKNEAGEDRLKIKEYPDLFSGLFWNGEQSVKMGLVDGLGNTSYVAREIVKAERIVDFTVRSKLFDRFAESFGAGFAKVFANTVGFESAGIK